MKVAVVGAGIFGSTIAWRLASHGYSVDLFEKHHDIMWEASGRNQCRLHRGYHYPRSLETALACKKGEVSFRAVYSEAVIDGSPHYYCIAKENSLTSTEDFRSFCRKCDLPLKDIQLHLVNPKKVESCFSVLEGLIDTAKLREICMTRFEEFKVKLIDKEATPHTLKRYDTKIIATYSKINELLPIESERDYQFELCEKPILQPPASLRGISIVVLDGPFMCLDPYGRTGKSLLGVQLHQIHRINIGLHPDIPNQYLPYLRRHVCRRPLVSKIAHLTHLGTEYVPEIAKCRYLGSMFTIRAIPPRREYDDARPTDIIVNRDFIGVHSGKIPTCVDAADRVQSILENRANQTSLSQLLMRRETHRTAFQKKQMSKSSHILTI